MLESSTPAKFSIPFGNGAGGGFIRPIPVASQIGLNAGFASLTDGFVPLNFTPVAAGGIPPFGQDMNGILNQITKWSQWQAAGGAVFYDLDFATSIGGYPRSALLGSALVFGNYWISGADNNLTDPDSASAAGWFTPPGMAGPGTLSYSIYASAPQGWVLSKANYTIGSAASGASFASASALFLYKALWDGFPNSVCPVSGGRGANAAADFAANKAMQVLDMSGTSIIGQDNATGRLTSVPVISGNANAAGAFIGENLHQLTTAEIASHTHGYSGTTATENANHSHAYSGNTGGENIAHQHTFSGTSGPENQTHTHNTTNYVNASVYGGGGSSAVAGPSGTQVTGIPNQQHNHDYSGTTASENIAHVHPYSGNTGIESAAHAHTFSGTTDGGTGGNGAHNTVQRSCTVNWILKL